MDLHRHLRSLALLVFILATYISTVLARRHPLRHHHNRHKRQHAHAASQTYLPGSFVVEGGAAVSTESGNWGPWSEPSDCSRSCGGGVAFQTRRCRDVSDTGTDLCRGGSKRYFSCNIQDCPEVSTDFRAEQCAEFNAVPMEGRYYKWVPYTKAPNKCELNCMPKGERFYYRHKSKVIDGTRCDEENLDICVDGQCLPVGCDMMLGSSAREDKCRECGGDGSSCNTIQGLLEMDDDLQVGYNDILLIPAGATNIRVREVQASNNYLAIRNVTGHYYLNGNWRIDFPRSLKFAGTIFHYERKPHGFFAPESVSALGPTTEPIYIVLLYQETNLGVQYEYSIPKGVAHSIDADSYSWIAEDFSECSATCGGGYQIRNVTCVRRRDLEVVADDLCDLSLEPARNQSCGTDPCPPHWFLGEWGPCSETCGEGGDQIRQVYCEQIVSGGLPSVVDDIQCTDLLGPKPPVIQKCNVDVPCPTWHVGPWKPCNRLCGEGVQKRRVRCFRRVEGKIEVLGDSACHEEKPEEEKSCELRPCEGVDWVVSDWSGCEDKCGLTQETRWVHCANQMGKIYPDERCQSYRLPELTRECESPVPCDHEWFASQWSECSARCGNGVKTRKVFCGKFDGDVVKKADDEKCDMSKKYESESNCTGKEECKGQWYAGPWTACSKPCGGGQMSRKVLCFIENRTVDANKCDPSLIHFSYEDCNRNPCSKDQIMPMEQVHIVSEEEEEECEEEEDGTLITVDTTLGLDESGAASVSDATQFEGSGELDVFSSESILSDTSSGTTSSDITSAVTPLTSRSDIVAVGTQFDSSLSSSDSSASSLSSIAEETSLLTHSSLDAASVSDDIMLRDSSGVSEDESTIYRASGSSDTAVTSDVYISTGSSVSSSNDYTSSSDDTPSSSSPRPDTSTASSPDVSDSTKVRSSSELSTSSEESSSTDASSETSSSDLSSSDESTDPTDSTSETASSSLSSINTSSEITLETGSGEGSGMTTDTDLNTDVISTFTGSGMGSIDYTHPDIGGEVDPDSIDDNGSGDIKHTSISSDLSAITESGTSESTSESFISTTETSVHSSTETTGSSLYTTESLSYATEISISSFGTTTEILEETVSALTSLSSADENETSVTTESSQEYTSTTEETPVISSTEVKTTAMEISGVTQAEENETSITTESSQEYTSTTEETPVISSTEVKTTAMEISGVTQEVSEETTPSPIEVAISKEQKVKKCKRKRKKPKPERVKCEDTEFGCCSDGITVAEGPFSKGCTQPTTCDETEFGCCADGVSPAKGRKQEGCPPTHCEETLFGCCPDGIGIAEGNDNEGCEVLPIDCKDTEFGCCQDGITAATGANETGCVECDHGDCDTCNVTRYGCCPDGLTAATGPEFSGCEFIKGSGELSTTEPEDCSNSTYGCCPDGTRVATGPNFEGCDVISENCTVSYYGCCPDGVSPALGPRYEGCRMPCEDEQFGCCSDRITAAHGPNHAGCCLTTRYGCCPDNIRPAEGPNLEGCGCQYSAYGCCPDNATAARGQDAEGCGCQYTKFGCCPNRYTPAAGPEFQGCPCYTYQFGCCPDGVNIARGPYNQGCGCENTEFGCCLDERTPARGPGKAGCGCEASKYGCCPDGETEAQGEKFEGCKEVPAMPGEQCGLDKDRGSCRDFKVKWFFDMEYGGCSRFWYGGCEGNDNRFSSQEECKEKCVEPPGRDACFLPKIEGPCEGYYPHWYYDSERKQCGQFIYGGCLGNNNRFETREECQDLCVIPDTLDVCEQPKTLGPCRGNFSRWYYDQDLRMCREFAFGGCHGNRNNFLTESECQHQCLQPGRSRDYCALPRDQGNCTEHLPRWFFDASENKCMPFYYSGCEGNDNRFETQEACETDCPSKVVQDLCLLPAASGECHNYTERWYYDSYHVRCTPFYYGGCGGNQNNFRTMQDCQRRCESGYVTPGPEEEFKTEWCFLRDDHGPCSDSVAKWFYDSRDGVCKQFLYGGCQGNQNQFSTRDECELRCGNVQDACDLPRVVGPCSGSITQWYYDRSTDACYEFDYGGCQGNANRFSDRQQCEELCKVITVSTAASLEPGTLILTTHAPPLIMDICSTPVDTGPCREEHTAWYYDSNTHACQAFIYGGCGGNANRFESEEQCERHCGSFKDQDVCNVPYITGPCQSYIQKWFYNPSLGGCQEFVYGGCGGNGNRFSSLEECERICLHREELLPPGNDTSLSHQAICQLPVDTGPCSGGYYKRWYFDEDRHTCIPFIYSGCAGNRNRFKNFQSCLKFCSVVLQPGSNEIDVGYGLEKTGEDKCQAFTQECSVIQCPYGVERFVDSDVCERCQCHDPCKGNSCPDQTQCAVDLYQNPQTGETEYRGVCRPTNKAGQCPNVTVSDGNCIQECQSDADCTGDTKCCFSGCVSSCLNPVFAEHITTQGPHLQPQPYGEPGDEAPRFEETETEPQVHAEEGNYVILRCVARGRPVPTIRWTKSAIVLDGSGRYKLLLDGSLQIIGLYRKDSGVYICTADNGIGRPIQREFQLEVTEPTSRPAEVIGEDKTYVVVTLGAPTVLQCYAVGWPPPTVTWWRGDRMLPLSSEQFEQRRDHSLLIRTVTLRNLGPYTCQAYNGYGRAASWTVTVQAVGPVYTSDSTYNEYLVPPPKKPDTPETATHAEKPSYPYRPVRPSPHPQPTTRPPVVQPASPPKVPPQHVPDVIPRVFTVPVQANVSLTRTVYPIGSDISIPCDVDGYPIPQVVWYKDEELLEPTERIHITENHRLLIIRANESDAGTYRCSASNQYGQSSSSISIAVEGVYIHPNCTDNPFFANCRLIVAGQYCTHKYYARFCCKSCTQAGQLPSYGPHLEKSGTSMSSSRRK